jgi:hypothetical protein
MVLPKILGGLLHTYLPSFGTRPILWGVMTAIYGDGNGLTLHHVVNFVLIFP